MKVDLIKTFEIVAPAETAWDLLQDIPKVASCMPGAVIDTKVDESHYSGMVKAKIGPATMAFNGGINVASIDVDKFEIHMIGSGQDTKGTSAAEMDLTVNIVGVDDDNCQLVGNARVTVNGKAASLGGRMLTQVADQILNQFGKNFNTNVAAMGEGSQAEEAQQVVEQQPRELNALAFAWSVFIGWISSFFFSKQK